MEGEAEDGGAHRADQPHGVEGDEAGAEGDAELDLVVEVGEVEPEEQLDDERDGAERPDVAVRDQPQERAGGEPHEGEDHAEAEAERGAVAGELEGDPDRAQDHLGGEELGEHPPLPAGVGGEAVGELEQQHGGGGHRQPAPGVADGDDGEPAVLVGVGSGGVGRRRDGRAAARRVTGQGHGFLGRGTVRARGPAPPSRAGARAGRGRWRRSGGRRSCWYGAG